MSSANLDEYAAAFAKSRDNSDFVKMMEELEDSIVFVPAQPSPETAAKIKEAAKSGQKVPFDGNAPELCLLTKKDGNLIFPIFTSQAQVPKENLPPALLNMPFKSVIGMLRANISKVSEIVVNPFTHGIVLNQKLIEVVENRYKAKEAQNDTVQLTEAQFNIVAHAQVGKEAMPKQVFADPEDFFATLRADKEKKIIDIYKEIYPEGLNCPYSEDDISCMLLQIEEDILLARIDLPDTSVQAGSPLRIYITKQDNGKINYYFVEKAEGDKSNCVVEVTADLNREVVADAPNNGVEIETIMKLVKE